MRALQQTKQAIRNKYAWPGGYPLFILTSDGAALCTKCARQEWRQICESTIGKHRLSGWSVEGADVNWEDTDLYCDHCNEQIESAYGEPATIQPED